MAADHKADSTAHSKPARNGLIRRLPAAAGTKPIVTTAVAVAGVAGIAATAIALSSGSAAHAGGNPTTPTRAAAGSVSGTARTATSSAKHAASSGKHAASTAKHDASGATYVAKHAAKKAVTSHKAATVAKRSPSAKPHTTLESDNKPATRWFTVESGDSLSSISGYVYGNSNDWPVLYYANQGSIASPNDINVGQVLKVPVLPATIPAAPASATVSTSTSTSTSTSSSSSDSSSSSASTSTASQADTSVDPSDYSGFQECVISRESGGDAQIMNSSGHYGLYQFSESTWVAYGGNPADFGDASVAEQNQVFENAMAAGGESNWAPYDGC